MKTTNRFFTTLAACASLTALFAIARGGPAPVVNGAVGAVGNIGVGLGAPPAAAGGALNSAGSARGGVGNQGAFSGATGVGAFDSTESIGERQERFRARQAASASASSDTHATTNASVMGEARGLTVATLAARGPSGSLDTATTVHAIQAQAMAQREQLLAELHTRADASAKAQADMKKSGAKLDGDARANFNAAAADVKAKEKALKKSMKAAEKASADTWTDARAKLATDYEAYAAAVAREEAAAKVDAKADMKADAKASEKEKPKS